jgi:MOSC domain-containing protein YiiM
MVPDFKLTVEGTFVGDEKHASSPRDEIILTLSGVVEDRHCGFTKISGVREKKFHPKGTHIWNSRQWSAVSYEELDRIETEMRLEKPVRAEWLGANLLFSGCADLSKLPPMTRLVFPDKAVLLVYGENSPCIWPGEVMKEKDPSLPSDCGPAFVNAALNRRGIVGWVERAGVIRPGDMAKVYLPSPS